jgi:CPA1 family monovalent cation:H+ antiporter
MAQYQEVNGRITQEYRNRIHLLDDSGVATSTEAQRDTPKSCASAAALCAEMELRMQCIHVERDFCTPKARPTASTTNRCAAWSASWTCRNRLRKRLVVARRAAGLPPLPHAGGAH